MKTSHTQFNSTRAILTLILIISFSAHLFSKTKTETINGGERFTIHSKALDEDRVILISLPDNYDNSDYSYPVLVVLDGMTHFRHATGATDYLARYGLTPGIIVVAVTNVDRIRDFSPVHIDQFPTSGGAEKFHKFIKNELLPKIKSSIELLIIIFYWGIHLEVFLLLIHLLNTQRPLMPILLLVLISSMLITIL